MQEWGRSFAVVPSAYRESVPMRASAPARHVTRHAVGKAKGALLARGAQGIVIGADTIVYLRGRIFGKPRTMAEAFRFLRLLSGKRHWVYTGLCLRDIRTGRWRASVDKSGVTFHLLSDEAIRRILRRVSPLDKAGGYAVQRSRQDLIARIDGSVTNVIGLPMELLRRELATLAATARRR